MSTPRIVAHLRELQRIARENRGNRAAATPGGEASIDYVAGRLRRAGYRVTLQPVEFPYFDERRRPRVTAGGRRLGAGTEVATLSYSGAGRVTGRPVRVAGLGCDAADHRALGRGDVAVVRRGTCTFRRKASTAAAAGARAVVIVDEAPAPRAFAGSLGRPGVEVPVVGVTVAAGEAVASARRVTVVTDTVSERRTTRNVVADTPSGDPRGTVVLGAHVDSVREGPGINDDGTGVAALLEIAERLADRAPPARRVRFGFWGAEELGLHGSRRYVRSLSRADREDLAAYVNLDMIGSPNAARLVYDGEDGPPGSRRVERVLREPFARAGLALDETGLRSGSDHVPFRRAGIAVGGLFTGAGARKTERQARRFGGRAGRPLDRCYHRACDTLANVDRRVLGLMAGAAAHALVRLAGTEGGGAAGAKP